jgi:hypothetical protein
MALSIDQQLNKQMEAGVVHSEPLENKELYLVKEEDLILAKKLIDLFFQ